MPNNINVNPSISGTSVQVATEVIDNVHYPIYKMASGVDGGAVSATNPLAVQPYTSDYNKDAWGRPKTVTDLSLFHGIWTYDVPNRIWEECSNTAGTLAPLDSTGTLATSEGNMLNVSSGTVAGNGCYLKSKRNPRYQPNRGHLYSTATIIPNAIGDGRRKFGLMCADTTVNRNGVYFELEGDGAEWAMYAVRMVDGTAVTRKDITADLPASYDPEKGHVYDINFQWRGVGSYRYMVDLQVIYEDNILGTLTALSLPFPAMASVFESVTDTTTALVLKAGCVDITSEGGRKDDRQFASITTGTTLATCDATGTALIAIKIPRTLSYDGGTVVNTRDLVASKLTTWCRDESSAQVYVARGNVATTLDALTWLNLPDSTAQYLVETAPLGTLDTAFQADRAGMQLVLNEWEDIEIKNTIINPSEDSAPFYLTAGDILVVVAQSIGGVDQVASSLYLSEEI